MAATARSRSVPSWLAGVHDLPMDIVGALTVIGLTAYAAWRLLVGGTMLGMDSATFFYPVYSLLGEQLRAGELPVWNPHQLAGTPLAADPQSGWTYLPAMLIFSLLPLTAAVTAFVLFHFVAAGLATYALARVLGCDILGALTAAVAYEFSGFFFDRAMFGPAYYEVAVWLPLLILGAELAIRSDGWLSRGCWWSLAGLALSQILAAWLGQGAYYSLLVLGGYVAYRTLVTPPPGHDLRWRPAWLALHGGAVLTVGCALAAAGLLPRLEYNAVSNVAGGDYRGSAALEAAVGGWTPDETLAVLLDRGPFYAGGAVLGLAIAALPLARARLATPFAALVALAALFLAARTPTPLHDALFRVLPHFEGINRHWPHRVMFTFYLGAALLAGAAVSSLPRWRRQPALLVFVASVPVLAALLLVDRRVAIPRPTLHALVFATLLVASYALSPAAAARRLAPALLLLLVFVDLVAASHRVVHPDRGFQKVDLERYYDATGAGAFLRAEARRHDQPFRYFGYDPQLQQPDRAGQYRWSFLDPRVTALLLNNRATLLGLQDVQGYNPVQIQRYAEYVTALNGRDHEYREPNVSANGLGSPLLDLLNVRYIVIPSAAAAGRADLRGLLRQHRAVYRDDNVRVLENQEALPRVWIVHQARQVRRGEALALLTSGRVDPRRVALLAAPPPPLDEPDDPGSDAAEVTEYAPDRIRVRARTTVPGLLMLSEVVYPAWRAYVDGEPAPLFVADHALRAVPVAAGEHVVELRYESPALRAGLTISLVGYAAVGALAAAAGRRRWLTGAAPVRKPGPIGRPDSRRANAPTLLRWLPRDRRRGRRSSGRPARALGASRGPFRGVSMSERPNRPRRAGETDGIGDRDVLRMDQGRDEESWNR